MPVVFHLKVYSDVSKIMEYYEAVASETLADEFYREFRAIIVQHSHPGHSAR